MSSSSSPSLLDSAISEETLRTFDSPTLGSASIDAEVHPAVHTANSDTDLHHDAPKAGRNLVVCIDGTANQFSRRNTNVVELYGSLEKSKDQLTYYNSGIGTYVKPSWTSPSYWWQFVNFTVDMMIAWNFKNIVLSAYQWLSENYQPGDRIFLFGFSRGAYQTRVIAGMIEKVGLLHKGNNEQIPFAYELYITLTRISTRDGVLKEPKGPGFIHRLFTRLSRICTAIVQSFTRRRANVKAEATEGEEHPQSHPRQDDDDPAILCEHFKKTLSQPDVKVHFVGTWDTVSSVGLNRGPSLPETTTGMTHVSVFRHALALDERRVKFLPEYVNGGEGPGPTDGGNVKEVWFVGSHSDIGGGIHANLDLNKFGPPLRWMTYEAMLHGLRVKPYSGKWDTYREPTKSLNKFYTLLEYYPFKRLSYTTKDHTLHWPLHRGGARLVKPGQKIHQSVIDAMVNHGYKPNAKIYGGTEWDDFILQTQDVVEADPYSSASNFLSERGSSEERLSLAHAHVLHAVLQGSGPRSITEYPGALNIIFSALKAEHPLRKRMSKRQHIVDDLVTTLLAFPQQPQEALLNSNAEIQRLIGMASFPVTPKTLNKVYCHIAQVPFAGHTAEVDSLAFSPDGSRLISGGRDHLIRIWDAQTGEAVMKPLEGHTDNVMSVAFYPDGTRIISGSSDGSIRVWDAQTGIPVLEPLMGHKTSVRSVAVAPDGKQFASGSEDRTIRVWDAQSGQDVLGPLEGHTSTIWSVAFYPDGKQIITGSYGGPIRIFDAHDGKLVMDALEGHDDAVHSFAFSPDGTRVVSGSWDGTIRVWDTQNGQLLMGPLKGSPVGFSVYSVAYSKDGARFYSACWDSIIRVWDAESGKQVMEPFRGHTRSVRFITVSPDGRRLASGSWDQSIRLWDLNTGEQVLGPLVD